MQGMFWITRRTRSGSGTWPGLGMRTMKGAWWRNVGRGRRRRELILRRDPTRIGLMGRKGTEESGTMDRTPSQE